MDKSSAGIMGSIYLLFVLFALFLASFGEENATSSEIASIDELLARIQAVTSEKESLLSENAEIRKRQIQLEKNIEHLTKKSSYIQELGKLEDKYAQLVTETSARTALLTEQISRLETELSHEKEATKRSIEAQCSKTNDETQMKELRATIATLEEQVLLGQARTDKAASTIADLERQHLELRTAIARLTHERDQLQLDVRSAGGAVTKAQKELHIMRDKYNTAVRKVEEQANKIAELEVHHDRCKEIAVQHEATVAALEQVKNSNNSVVRRAVGAIVNPFRDLLGRLRGLVAGLLRSLRLQK